MGLQENGTRRIGQELNSDFGCEGVQGHACLEPVFAYKSGEGSCGQFATGLWSVEPSIVVLFDQLTFKRGCRFCLAGFVVICYYVQYISLSIHQDNVFFISDMI